MRLYKMIKGDDQGSGGKGTVEAFNYKYSLSFPFSQGSTGLTVDHLPMPVDPLETSKGAEKMVDIRGKTRRILEGLKDRRVGKPVPIFLNSSLWKLP
jgi:hypothetical protein